MGGGGTKDALIERDAGLLRKISPSALLNGKKTGVTFLFERGGGLRVFFFSLFFFF